MNTMKSRSWHLPYLEIETNQACSCHSKAVDAYAKMAVWRKRAKRLLNSFQKVYEGYVDLSFAESVQLTALCLHSMLKNVHFCSGRRLPQFGVDQRFSSEKLPEGAFFAYFQVV